MRTDKIEDLIYQFKNAKRDQERIGKSAKTGIIGQLEELMGDDRVILFFLDLLSDTQEFDLARIEVLRILECYEIKDETVRKSAADAVFKILRNDPDNDVRAWATGTASNYLSYDFVSNELERIIRNQSEDEIIRGDSFMVLRRAGFTSSRELLMRELLNDETFSKGAKQVLMEWNV